MVTYLAWWGLHTQSQYSSNGRTRALYKRVRHSSPASPKLRYKRPRTFLALQQVACMCCAQLKFSDTVTPSSLKLETCSMGVPSMEMLGTGGARFLEITKDFVLVAFNLRPLSPTHTRDSINIILDCQKVSGRHNGLVIVDVISVYADDTGI